MISLLFAIRLWFSGAQFKTAATLFTSWDNIQKVYKDQQRVFAVHCTYTRHQPTVFLEHNVEHIKTCAFSFIEKHKLCRRIALYRVHGLRLTVPRTSVTCRGRVPFSIFHAIQPGHLLQAKIKYGTVTLGFLLLVREHQSWQSWMGSVLPNRTLSANYAWAHSISPLLRYDVGECLLPCTASLD